MASHANIPAHFPAGPFEGLPPVSSSRIEKELTEEERRQIWSNLDPYVQALLCDGGYKMVISAVNIGLSSGVILVGASEDELNPAERGVCIAIGSTSIALNVLIPAIRACLLKTSPSFTSRWSGQSLPGIGAVIALGSVALSAIGYSVAFSTDNLPARIVGKVAGSCFAGLAGLYPVKAAVEKCGKNGERRKLLS